MLKRLGALAVAGSLLVVVGCGDDGDGSEDASSSSDGSSEETVSAETAAFCDEMEAHQDQVSDPPDDAAGFGGMEAYFTQTLETVRSVTPPDELADDWATIEEAFSAAVDASAEVDWDALQGELEGMDQEDTAAMEETMQEAMEPMAVMEEEAFVEAGDRIDTYLQENCEHGDLDDAGDSEEAESTS